MRERPILMSAPMVRASMRDVDPKTQTRRVIPAPWLDANPETETGRAVLIASCRYGVVGDRLWVREAAWIAPPRFGDDVDATHRDMDGRLRFVGYDADMNDDSRGTARDYGVRKTPSIHMPRWASRLTLEIASVRVERVQSISDADARAEGVALGQRPCSYVGRCNSGRCPAHNYVPAFAALWDETNGARPGCSWADDPWVFAIEFRRLPPDVESAVRAQMGAEGR